jgi:hypothetical protein
MLNKTKQYAAISQYDGMGEIREVFVGTYDECLDWAGERWEQRDLSYDKTKTKPFWDADGGSVEITKVKGKIAYVSHAEGQGPVLTIVPVVK